MVKDENKEMVPVFANSFGVSGVMADLSCASSTVQLDFMLDYTVSEGCLTQKGPVLAVAQKRAPVASIMLTSESAKTLSELLAHAVEANADI